MENLKKLLEIYQTHFKVSKKYNKIDYFDITFRLYDKKDNYIY